MTGAHASLAAALGAVVPDGSYAAHADAIIDPSALAEPERRAIAHAIARRVAEFTGGRIAARRALAALGIGAVAVPADESRAPLWPSGVVGSISHSGGCCIAVVASNDRHRSMGLDIEAAVPLGRRLWDTVCTPAELAWLRSQPPRVRGALAKALFSIKESVYKWQYPLTRMPLGFKDVGVEYLPETRVFHARFVRPPTCNGTRIRRLSGRTAAWGDKIVTAVIGE